jgi:hypothetical protein
MPTTGEPASQTGSVGTGEGTGDDAVVVSPQPASDKAAVPTIADSPALRLLAMEHLVRRGFLPV